MTEKTWSAYSYDYDWRNHVRWLNNTKTLSALLAFREGNPSMTDGFPSQRANAELLFIVVVWQSKLFNKNRVGGGDLRRYMTWMGWNSVTLSQPLLFHSILTTHNIYCVKTKRFSARSMLMPQAIPTRNRELNNLEVSKGILEWHALCARWKIY